MRRKIKTSTNYSQSCLSRQDYLILILVYIGGICWLVINLIWHVNITICPTKLLWHIPCPACGVTRACVLFLHGKFWEAIALNANVLILLPLSILLPVTIFSDKAFGSNWYTRLNQTLSSKYVIIAFIIFEGFVWTHNISLGL